MVRVVSLTLSWMLVAACSSSPTEGRSKEKAEKNEDDADQDDEGGKKKKKQKHTVDPCDDGDCEEGSEGGAESGEAEGGGEGGEAEAGEAESQDPETPLPEFSLLGPFGKVSKQPHVSWQESKGATAYDLVVASDAACKTVLMEKKDLKDPKADLTGLATGEVYLCVTAKTAKQSVAAKNNAQKVTVTQGWIKSATPTPVQTRVAGLVWTGEAALLWAGTDNAFNIPIAKLHKYDPVSDQWAEVTTGGTKPPPAIYPGTVWTGDRMYAWGGYASGSTVPHGARYDAVKKEWQTFTGANEPNSSRSGAGVAWAKGKLHVYGGVVTGAASAPTPHMAYDPANDAWTAVGAAGEPSARQYHCMVSTGDGFIVYGGYTPTTAFNTGFIYDAAKNQWKAMSITGAPASRYSHSCAFDGTKLYVFGGNNLTTIHADGGVYDLATDTWAPLPLPAGNALTRRFYHSAVWTGEAMLITGGTGPETNSELKEAWLYFP